MGAEQHLVHGDSDCVDVHLGVEVGLGIEDLGWDVGHGEAMPVLGDLVFLVEGLAEV